ncbi:DUF5134 domain-containing protein [Humibacter ginsenosidimutans]|uniref:DUF5134 domain-containing protein n=1 Tax=Humibacter ginsenosidimutans TaxID=2599293 RepID=A0A5B8M1I7_9MICO|nr:DUF5134 domain-containing protein [Humibacter ginsenosidimutans]QDZ13572.1 DUF5134 domain-containing protein [Humibacter ginsenosidimutans]
MIAVVVTVLFAITGAYCLVRVAVGYSWIDRVSNGVHVVMSLVMLAMPWPWVSVFATAAQIAFFTAAALWYVYLALFDVHADAGPGEGHHRGPALLWYHAGMMAAMVWMAVAMTPFAAQPQMPGMDMSHMQMTMSSGSGMTAMTAGQPWAITITWVFGILFCLATLWFLIRLVRQAIAADSLSGREGVVLLDSLVSAVMAAGMAIAFLILMT